MSHRLQTHYHITATPANREAAPRIQVELHQCSLIQLPRATRSNKPCLLCVLAGWRDDGAFQRACVQVPRSAWHTHKCTFCHPFFPPNTHIHTVYKHVLQTLAHQKSSRPLNPQPPKHKFCAHQLLKLSRCTLSRKSEPVRRKQGWTIWRDARVRIIEKGFY